MTITTVLRGVFALVAAVALTAGPAFAQDEPQAFNAFAIGTANGTMTKSGEKQLMFVGTLGGPMFVETDEGPVEAGRVVCAASVRVDLDNQHQAGSGSCTFTANDEAQAWGDFECTGYALIGCHGKLKLTGGSARLAGATGEGDMIWRPSAHAFVKQGDGTAQQSTSGILIWRDFKLGKTK